MVRKLYVPNTRYYLENTRKYFYGDARVRLDDLTCACSMQDHSEKHIARAPRGPGVAADVAHQELPPALRGGDLAGNHLRPSIIGGRDTSQSY